MKITFITLFPKMFEGPFRESILKHAQEKNLLELAFVDIRDFGVGDHHTVDDTDYGGGTGMILKVDVLKKALDHARNKSQEKDKEIVLLMTADGQSFTQRSAEHLVQYDHIIIICGHYEGFDERIKKYVDLEISIGDFVLTGGELAAMIVADCVGRLITGVLKTGVTDSESFSHISDSGDRLLEYPHYTKPQVFEDYAVPSILLSGNHKLIEQWRKEKSIEKTNKNRPDLIKNH